MIIANPIYDIIFKRLMENRRIARFFVETLIGEHVVDIAMLPQEYTYYSKTRKKPKDEEMYEELKKDEEIAELKRLLGKKNI
jgi:hypothetical protein